MKKNIILAVVALFFIFFGMKTILAQSSGFDAWRKKADQEYEAYKAKGEKEYQAYRDRVNAEFAEYMSRTWENFPASSAIPAPKPLEPVAPVVVEPEKKPTIDLLPFDDIKPSPPPTPRPQPILPSETEMPEETNATGSVPTYSFLFYNTECNVSLDNTHRFSLSDVSEQNITQAWKILSGNQYNALIRDCLALRDQLNLCDWGYLQLLKTMSENFLSKTSNEAVLLQMFILTQSGYKVRIARTNNQLALLVPFRQTVYGYTYMTIGGTRYYVINKELKGQSFYICNQEFPKEQYFSWQTRHPRLTEQLTTPKTFASTLYPEMQVSIQSNKNLIDFYNNYPLTSEWNVYTVAGLGETVKKILYPMLKNTIAGKTKKEAAEMLLSFLQFAFDYQTDDKQFGYERPFFADENFYYPYNNCKDRAILYCILVKELLGLEAVLLHYPGHLATAVHFSEEVSGDYLIIDGKKFVVCDPTYVGARIGMAMDQCKLEKAQVIKL
jgi:hypothetical protein